MWRWTKMISKIQDEHQTYSQSIWMCSVWIFELYIWMHILSNKYCITYVLPALLLQAQIWWHKYLQYLKITYFKRVIKLKIFPSFHTVSLNLHNHLLLEYILKAATHSCKVYFILTYFILLLHFILLLISWYQTSASVL